MPDLSEPTVWTVGHSTRTFDELVSMLESFSISLVIDIRHFPGSRRFPHFNKDALEFSFPQHNISYLHLPQLGGRRKASPGSNNTAWQNEAFRGYADYMQTPAFREGIDALEQFAAERRTTFMCSEAVWWRCHRSLVSDYLKCKGWKVMHITEQSKQTEHPYTKPARIINGQLSYTANDLFGA